MSYTTAIGVSADHSTHLDEDRSLGEDSFQQAVASSDTSPGVQQSITPINKTDFHQGDGANETSAASSPSLDRYRRRPSPAEGEDVVVPTDLLPNAFDQGTTEKIDGPNTSTGHAEDGLQRRAQGQQQPVPPALSVTTNTSTRRGGTPRAASPVGLLKMECEGLRKKQEDLHMNIDGPPRTPTRDDFPSALSMKIVRPIKPPVKNCIILMHSIASNETFLEDHTERLQTKIQESAFILLRGLHPIEPGNSGYHWADATDLVDEGFISTSRVILKDIVQDGLMARCNFQPRDVVILGYGQGGMAALAAAASWNSIEFGGVVSYGGPMPGYVQLPHDIKAKTPALIYGCARGDLTPNAIQQIQENFTFVDRHIPDSEYDTVPLSDQELAPLIAFFEHRLGRAEWERQALMSFDGGGIRGYGSLLILQDLMNKIGELEKGLDETTESSFSPCDYKPTRVEPSDTGAIGPSEWQDLPGSALFLPCHYFTYAAGTSTGGLISIMLSRLRMTVDDCIEEYKSLGNKVFGHPRRMARGGFPWHRFNANVLVEVIRAVTARHNINSDGFESHYGLDRMDEDMSQCIVLAYSNNVSNDGPYLFRTYGAEAPPLDPDRSGIRQRTLRNPGGASMLKIWEVARATSAAPGYFSPTKVKTDNGSEVKFKDGGFGSNNPSLEAYRDVVRKHGSTRMGPFISFGTGTTQLDMFGKGSTNFSTLKANAQTALKLPSRTSNAHETMVDHAHVDGEERFPYFRFDGGSDLGEVDLDEWETHRLTRITGKDGTSGRKTLKKIETAVALYLRRQDVQKDLMKCARLLVERRRLRARDASRWDRYASYSYYKCDMKECQRPRVNTAHDFKEHLRRDHRLKLVDPVIDNKISECRRVQWLYPPVDVIRETST